MDRYLRSSQARDRLFGWLVGLAATLPTRASAAHNEPAGVALEWAGPSECPAEGFRAALDRYLAESTVDRGASVRAHLTRENSEWLLEIAFTTVDSEASRLFRSPRCDSVVDAAALVVAIAIDPTVLDRLDHRPDEASQPDPILEAAGAGTTSFEIPSPPSIAPQPEHAGPAAQVRSASATPSHRRTEQKVRGLAGVGGLVDGLALPGAGGGIAAWAGATGRWWRSHATFSYRFATRKPAELDPEVGGAFSLWTLGVRGCPAPAVGPLEFPLCAGLEAGEAIGRGYGIPGALRARVPWVALVLAPTLAWKPHPRLAIVAGVEVGVPLLRHSFEIERLEVIHRLGAVHIRGLLGLEARFL